MKDPGFQKRLREAFAIEAAEHVQEITSGLIELEKTSEPARRKALIETIFRDAHSLKGAAGAVETVVCLMALRGQWLPPSVTLQALDPACRFPIVQQPTDAKLDYALTNSFGFGGANATLILRRWS